MIDFLEFWKLYPRRVAKLDAQKAWKKVPEVEQQMALDFLEAMNRLCGWPEIAFIPYPASWIRGKRWEDELDDVAPLTSKEAEVVEMRRNLYVGRGPEVIHTAVRVLAQKKAL